jgi:hypothetical protein
VGRGAQRYAKSQDHAESQAMNSVNIVRGNGESATVEAAAIEQLKASLRGALLLPGDDGYDK